MPLPMWSKPDGQTRIPTHPLQRPRARAGRTRRGVLLALFAGAALTLAPAVNAANILWVSDVGTPNTGQLTPPNPNFTDQGFVDLLIRAGHNVNRYNQSNNNGSVSMSAAELTFINTNDLIIIGRAGNSPTYQNFRATNWNHDVTRPVIVMSPYFVRPDGNRLGWFTGGTLPDDLPTRLTPGDASNPVVDYIFQDAAMDGANTAELFDEPMDRNTSHIQNTPVPGALQIATVTTAQEANAAVITANAITAFPAGTVTLSNVVLGGYRMYFSGGTRESATAPNAIWYYTGRENLTPMGEKVFLRAVEVAINNGVAPSTHSGALVQTLVPTNTTVAQGGSVTFSAAVQGAAPRLVWWVRNSGTGFTNIPGTFTAFERTSYTLTNLTSADSGAQFAIMYSNSLGNSINPVSATLTVTPDAAAPVPLSAASLDGSMITVCFNEFIDQTAMTADPSAYSINGGASVLVTSVTAGADGKSVNLFLDSPIGATGTVDFFYVQDIFGNVAFSGPTIVATNFGLAGVDIGTVTPAGSQFACDPNSLQVTAGGVDIGSTADNLHFVYKTVSGDFDARVQVASFVGTAQHFETTAKAMLLARVNNTAGSADVKAWVTPAPPGDNLTSASYRSASGGATNSMGPSVGPSGIPNAWLRLQRVGNQYTTYAGTNGTDWTTIGTASVALGASLNVGVGVISHRSTAAADTATATFRNFLISQGVVPVTTTITRPRFASGQFTAFFQTQNGSSYVVEYKDNLNTVSWSTLTTIPGDGTEKSFNDPGPVSATGNRFYRITVQ